MEKREVVLVAIILAFTAVMIIGCSNRKGFETLNLPTGQPIIETPNLPDKPSEPTGNPTEFSSDNPPEPEPTEEPYFEKGACIISGSYIAKYDLVDIEICFPQLHEYPNQNIEDKVNKLIYDFVITHNDKEWGMYRYQKLVNFEVTLFSEKHISIVFSGFISSYGYSAYHNSITIDLETGNRVFLSELYSRDEVLSIIDTFMLTEKCEVMGTMWENQTYAREFLYEPCITWFRQSNDYASERFYLRENKLGIIFNLTPQEHPAVEFELSEIPWK